MGGDNVNDFDFGGVIGGEDQNKGAAAGGGDDFKFNFGGDQPAAQQAQPASGGADLMDLLGGLDMSAPAQPQPTNTNNNALDFLNAGGDMGGALGAAAAQNSQNNLGDPFGANQNATNVQ